MLQDYTFSRGPRRRPLERWPCVHFGAMSTRLGKADGHVVADGASKVLARLRRTLTRYEFVGIAIPVAVAMWVAYTHVLSFDGAMNMQVAQNLAHLHVFGRDYGGMVVFPSEIQTSSYFVAISAFAIAVFGTNGLTLQAANLVFVAVLAWGLAKAVAPSRVAAVVFPSLVVFGAPGVFEYSLGGYGEGTVAALAFCAFLLLARAIAKPKSAVLLVAFAFVALGIAASIKTVAIAALVPAVLAVVFILWRAQWRRWLLVLAPFAGFVPLAVFEVYRLLVLRRAYFTYWKDQANDILYQAGGDSARSSSGSESLPAKVGDHLSILSDQTGVPGALWVVALVAVPLGLVFLLRWRSSWDQTQIGRMALAAMLTIYAEVYFVWWLAITPTEKAWLRRLTIGTFALIVAAALVASLLVALVRRTSETSPRDRIVAIAVAVAVVLPSTLALVQGIGKSASWWNAGSGRDAALKDLSGQVESLASEGSQFYGVGWWSAPVVSLYSSVNFDDLRSADLCAPSTYKAIENGDAYLVWDFYAKALANEPVPTWPGVELELSDVSNEYGALWRISLPPDTCSS